MISSIWRNRTYSLFLGASCLIFVGCGGSDVPDPSMDGQAAAPEAVARPEQAQQTTAEEPKAEEPAHAEAKTESPATPAEPKTAPAAPPEQPTAVASAEQPKPASPEPSPTPVATTPAAAPPAVSEPAPAAETNAKPAEATPKPDLGGTTSEMLALSSGSAPAPPSAAGASAGGSGAGNAPGSGPATSSTNFGDSRANGGTNPPLGRDRNNGEAPPTRTGSAASGRTTAMRRDEAGGGILGRGGRDEEGGRGPGRDPNKPVDFTNPRESVQAFLDALKDKDVERLSEATALRSPFESSVRNRELFQSILEGNISEAQLNDLAEKLDEYTIVGEAPVTSTGKLGILISRTVDNNQHQRTVIVRKEKAGWKVLDITSVIDFGRNGRGTGGGTRGGRR